MYRRAYDRQASKKPNQKRSLAFGDSKSCPASTADTRRDKVDAAFAGSPVCFDVRNVRKSAVMDADYYLVLTVTRQLGRCYEGNSR